jgi:hypothetical protein
MMELIALRLLAFVTLGGLLAFAYLAALDLNVRLYLDRGSGWFALLVHAARGVAIVVAFSLCAHQSAMALLSSFVGFQIMRIVALNQKTLGLESRS